MRRPSPSHPLPDPSLREPSHVQVKKHWESILDVTAIVLANLCVAYIMTSQVARVEEQSAKS